MKVRLEVVGEEAVRQGLIRLGQAGKLVARRVFADELARWVPAIKADTPVDPEDGGQLRDSVRVSRPTITKAGRVSAGIVAGGAPLRRVMGARKANVYAVIQHEDLTLRHTTGGGKFIERTFMRRAPGIPELLLVELDREAAILA